MYHELAELLEQALAEQGYEYSIRTMRLPKWMIKFGAFFSNELGSVAFLCDEPPRTLLNQKSRQELGIEYKRSVKELVLATAESMIN